LDDRRGEFAFDFVADGLKEVRFAKPGISIDEQWIIGIAGRLADCDTACVGEAVAGADDEILESIIGVKGEQFFVSRARKGLFGLAIGGKLDCDEVAGNELGGAGEGAFAFILQEVGAGLVGAADFEKAAGKTHEVEVIEPLARIYGVQGSGAVEYFREDIFRSTFSQDALLYTNSPEANKPRLRRTSLSMMTKTMPQKTEVTRYITSMLLKRQIRPIRQTQGKQTHCEPKTFYHPL